jgi:hypothetical protein
MTRLLGLGGILVGLLLVAPPAAAQSTADSYFHEAARAYVAGDRAAARRAVTQGLQVAPSDPRLRALREKLRESGRPERRQDSSSTSSGRRDRQNANQSSDTASEGGEDPSQSQEEGSSRAGPRDASSGERSGQGRRSADRRSERRGPRDGEGASGQRRAEARADTTGRGAGGRRAATLSRAQAERLLRALEGQERRLLRQLRPRSTERRTVEKDW